jgi:hypothetical protein
MVRLSYFLCGVNAAGTTFVVRRVDAPRATQIRPIWCPEWFLSGWEREGPKAGSTYIGEYLIRSLAVDHKAVFNALELTPPQRFAPEDDKVEELLPFDWKGAMRLQCIAVAMGHSDTSLRIVPFEGDKEAGVGEVISLERLGLLGTPEAWRVFGDLVLGALATLHPELSATLNVRRNSRASILRSIAILTNGANLSRSTESPAMASHSSQWDSPARRQQAGS